jgi:hypothetical protein
MKRYCKLFLFVFSLLFLNNGARCASSESSVNSNHVRISKYSVNSSYSLNNKERDPKSIFTQLLFRKGIEGKSPLLSFAANTHSLIIGFCLADFAVSQTGWIKYILSFSRFLTLTPQFLSSFSLHAPPVLS